MKKYIYIKGLLLKEKKHPLEEILHDRSSHNLDR
jgi:hypothetical protein